MGDGEQRVTQAGKVEVGLFEEREGVASERRVHVIVMADGVDHDRSMG